MNKLGGKYQRNRWFVLLMIPIFVYQIIYISTATANVPLMDYWRYINMFVEKINTTGLSFGDIWKNDHIHRSPLQFFYFAANIRLFNYNIQIEEYLGVFLMTLTIFLLYRWIKKEMPNQISAFYGIAGTIIALILFNSNQWEMITQEFALSFASRQILFFMSFLLTSRYLTNLHSQKAKTVELALLYILTILLVGSGYFPAFVATVAFSVILNYVLFYKENKNTYLVQYIVLLGALAVGTILYMYGIDLASNVPKIKYSLGECVVQFLQGSFVMIAVSWYGFAFSQRTMLVVGAVIFALYIAAFVVFSQKILQAYACSYLVLRLWCGSDGTSIYGAYGNVRFGLCIFLPLCM